jgi:feruloyl esterase
VRFPTKDLIFVLFALAASPLAAASPCESMANLKLPNTTIVLVQAVAAGAFTPPKPFPFPVPTGYKDLPAFCRVALVIRPTTDSNIKVEMWMPLAGWNGKFQAIGNGAWSGEIWYPFMSPALAAGYATASTDTGHEADPLDASFALGHPEKVIDFGYRAVHEMTLKAKAIISAFYGNPARLSYWNGCSSGGKQGLKEAQQFPLDYDGIVAGAPANNWTHLMAAGVSTTQTEFKNEDTVLSPDKLLVLHNAAVEACDALDGLKDGLMNDPKQCHFDPQALLCKEHAGPDCLTAGQVATAKRMYADTTNLRTGAQILPGWERGSELEWSPMGGTPGAFVSGYFKYVVFKDPAWDYHSLDLDRDVALADKMDQGTINAVDPNLKPFLGHGGKLILYHGWSDGLIPPQNTINYYNSVVTAMGGPGKTQNSVRLFLLPGMQHCVGGDGPNGFDAVTALDQWVDKGKAPDQIIAAHVNRGKVDRTRPLCPYPQVAKYKGTGSTEDATNFACQFH